MMESKDQQAFAVPFEKLKAAVIQQLLEAHPDALPVRIEWTFNIGGGGSAGSAVVWWVPCPADLKPALGGAENFPQI